jgi:hypothetical protein
MGFNYSDLGNSFYGVIFIFTVQFLVIGKEFIYGSPSKRVKFFALNTFYLIISGLCVKFHHI